MCTFLVDSDGMVADDAGGGGGGGLFGNSLFDTFLSSAAFWPGLVLVPVFVFVFVFAASFELSGLCSSLRLRGSPVTARV